MSVKDKVIFGLMIILIVGGGYIQYTYTQVMKRMDIMEQKQLKHVDEVNSEFSDRLHTLELEFIGRAKHIKKAQKDIVANTDLIHATNDTLTSEIEDVAYNLDNFKRDTQKDFGSVRQDIQDQQDALSSERRQTRLHFSDVEQSITLLQNDLKKIQDKLAEADKDKKGKR